METIEDFRQAISNLYSTRENGLTEEDTALLNFLETSAISFQFAIKELSSDNYQNIPILLESAIIISKFVTNSWNSFNLDDQGIIIDTLLQFVANSPEITAPVNKAFVCIASIISFTFNRQLFERVISNLTPDKQADFIIILIDEISIREKVYEGRENLRDQFLLYLSQFVTQLLIQLPVSTRFLKLSRTGLSCFESYGQYELFLEKFEIALSDPNNSSDCSDFVRTILISSPIQPDDPFINFYLRIMKYSMDLSDMYAQQNIFDISCCILNDVVNFSPKLYENEEFSRGFLAQLLSILPHINIYTPDLFELVKTISDIFTNDQLPLLVNELIQLFIIIVQISDYNFNNTLDNAISNIYDRIPEPVTQILTERIQNPSPGLFIVVCQCNMPKSYLEELSRLAIQMKKNIPCAHLLVFMKRIGLSFPQFREQWFEMILEFYQSEPVKSVNILVSLLEKFPDLILKLPPQFLESFVMNFESLVKLSIVIPARGIKLFNFTGHPMKPLFFEKLFGYIMDLTSNVISVMYPDNNYFFVICNICKALDNNPEYFEFKNRVINSTLGLIAQASSENENFNQEAMNYLISELTKLFGLAPEVHEEIPLQ